jgi:ubiquinone/menaquinone biosynthesis C-methylase UbiE
MPDVYATIAEADAELQEQLAGVLELRAADPAQRAMLDEYTARLGLPDGAAVLEVGCGTGAIARRLSVLPGVVRVTGVDPSAQFIARARELAEDLPIAFAVGDGRALSLPGEAFDAVVFHTSLCHMPDCELALDEAHRVLRPGGRIAVFDGDYATTTMARNERDPLQSCAEAVVAMLVHDPWLMRRIAPLLEHHGFADAELRGHSYVSASGTDYFVALVDRGADALAAEGTIRQELAAALKAEGRARMADGAFFGHIGYVSALARRP